MNDFSKNTRKKIIGQYQMKFDIVFNYKHDKKQEFYKSFNF